MLRVMYGAQEKNSFVSRLSLGSDKSELYALSKSIQPADILIQA